MVNTKVFKFLTIIFISNLITSIHAADEIKILNLKSEPTIESSEKSESTSTATPIVEERLQIKVLYKTQNLTPEAALLVAQAAMKNCRDSGYQVSVAVLDHGGAVQVLIRDRLAGFKTPDIAVLKAQTALSFKSSTASLASAVVENKSLEGVRDVPGVLFLGGGITITAAGAIIGAIGVAGAPDSKFDERCAIIGLDPIKGSLEFAE